MGHVSDLGGAVWGRTTNFERVSGNEHLSLVYVYITISKGSFVRGTTTLVRNMSSEVPPTKAVAAEEEQKVIKTLEEDDEFEDFPEDDKFSNEPKVNTANLWEEDWDDDDNQDEFSKKLRDELKKSQNNANPAS